MQKNDGAFGNSVMIKDVNGKYHLFGHMSTMGVKAGQKVNAGNTIGKVGSTGRSTGNHLHYEVRNGLKYGSDIDPHKYLK